MNDQDYMKRAIELAMKGWGKTNPNPLVGAVIVKDGRIIGEGYHEKIGSPHAEIMAIRNCTESVEGATIYVNLEPCSHYGKTPPCADEIVRRKFARVVIAMTDPNPLVAGRGIALLRENNIVVDVGIMELEAKYINDIFIKYITAKAPFVLLKAATTLDGKTATASGDSKWITCEKSREAVHKMRCRYKAILVGVNTVIKDDPLLTARPTDFEGINPVRVILDSTGRIPLEAQVLKVSEYLRTIVATTEMMPRDKIKKLQSMGIEVIITSNTCDRVDLKELLGKLYEMGIDSVMVEGGGTVAAAFLNEGLVDKTAIFIAPKIIGGQNSLSPVMGEDKLNMSQSLVLKNRKITEIDEDILIEGYIRLPWEESE